MRTEDGYRKYFNADGTVNENGQGTVYTKSTEFKTVAEIKQYFNTYLAPELYAWLDTAVAEGRVFETADGVYDERINCGRFSYYPQTISLTGQDGDTYTITVMRNTEDGPMHFKATLQGIIENGHFKITKDEHSLPFTLVEPKSHSSSESLPENLYY